MQRVLQQFNRKFMNQELKLMGYYINVTRKDQVVQIKDLQRGRVWYEVIRQTDSNTITDFVCTEERFKNLYIPRK